MKFILLLLCLVSTFCFAQKDSVILTRIETKETIYCIAKNQMSWCDNDGKFIFVFKSLKKDFAYIVIEDSPERFKVGQLYSIENKNIYRTREE